MVHRPQRLAEILDCMRTYRLEPKRLRMVHSSAEEEAVMILVEGARGGKCGMNVEKPLVIYERPGIYAAEIKEIYNT